ncbi:MAG: hypothetical protein MJB14_23375 [Spirochaetes bacterium]|nr:hypothetical protein [Spirochaetota bacterium]
MAITQQHITGFLLGAGTAAVSYYVYKKNQDTIHNFLENQGIHLPRLGAEDNKGNLSLEDLVLEKEKIEDLIAEKELEMKKAKNNESKKKA